jgi:hypothetical protein
MAGLGPLGFLQAGVGTAQAITGMIGMGKAKRKAEAAVEAIGTYRPAQEIGQVYEGAKLRSTTGLGGASKQLATQGIERAATGALAASQDRRAGLGLVGTSQEMKQRGALQLAKMEEEAQARNQAALTQTARMQGAEKEKSFKSAQEKQSLKANIALQEVGAKRAAITQGFGAVAGGLATAAGAGEANPLKGILGKGAKFIGGLFGKKKKTAATPTTTTPTTSQSVNGYDEEDNRPI